MNLIKAALRQEFGGKINKQREAGKIPAVVYGNGIQSQPLWVGAKEFEKTYKEAGETSVITLELEGAKRNVLIHDVQMDSVDDEILHVDFYEVRMDQKIKASVQLVFVGESEAVKAHGGILVKNIQEVEVEALPQDLPHHIEVDISPLNSFEDRILIKNLVIAGSAKILAELEEIVASVAQPRSEEELAALEQKIETGVEEIKVVGEEEKAGEAAEAEVEKKEEGK